MTVFMRKANRYEYVVVEVGGSWHGLEGSLLPLSLSKNHSPLTKKSDLKAIFQQGSIQGQHNSEHIIVSIP